jgi:MFS family permease
LVLAGRISYGFSTGLIAVAMPRYMEEMLPPNILGVYGGLYCFSFAQATIIAYMLALGMPSDKDADGNKNTEELKNSSFWMIIFGLPIPFYLFQILLMYTVFPNESPKFLILKIEKYNMMGLKQLKES